MAGFEEILEEAIRLERLIGELYLLFSRQHRQDEPFWWKLTLEEENHAALLKTVRKMDEARVPVPTGRMLPESLELLRESTTTVEKSIEDFEENPDRTRAFQAAYEIETLAGEAHYNEFMTTGGDSQMIRVFRKLNGDDVDHAQRIRNYMKNHGIPDKS